MEIMIFTSKKGREYALDNSTNMIFPVSSITNTRGISTKKDDLRICQIRELRDEAKRWEAKFGCFSDRNIGEREVSFSKYKEYIGLFREIPIEILQLNLIITEECNLQCKYCVYSGVYKYERVRNKKSMPFLVAKKSIEHFIEHYLRISRIKPIRRLMIGFYGGEPLLEFDLITKIMKYCSDRYPNLNNIIMWNITTNGTLLSQEIVRFLVGNNVSVSVSLDGPEEEHDRNRVYEGGKGSFNEVFEGIIRLKEEIKNAGKEHMLPYMILTCFDTRTNLEKVNDFFVTNVETLGMTGRVGSVKSQFTSYYDNLALSPAEEEEFHMRYRILEERYCDAVRKNRVGLKDIFLERLMGDSLREVYARSISSDGRHLSPLLGGCLPGMKISVDCEGNFHMCERMNCNFPIGNYIDGIDILKVRQVIQKWKEATQKCILCPISGACGICYAMCATDDKFDIEEVCLERKSGLTQCLVNLYSLLEENPRTYESLSYVGNELRRKYGDFMKHC
ncbi:MAG: Anaerobic sulfatase-maturating enzyme [Syntrophomonadaceae bacterium]|nr:Anaerobic sulfatase-maturating enzyme [Bacillota bacterium]MBT9147663.1 Anaerobic sulfatase-maturating enzyme [Bacillota bacterium]